mgnify:CR=1 FL=1
MIEMNKLFIVIVSFNGIKWIKNCLASCEGHNVIVVDNCSIDGTPDLIRNNFPNITLIEQSKNLGFGAANNIGFRRALDQGAKFLFLMNQDVYLKEGTITKLLHEFKKNENYGILSPVHLSGSGDCLDENFAVYTSNKKNKKLVFDMYNNQLRNVYDFDFINAAAWLIPTSVIKLIGGFDPIFFHYQEDNNYCQRIRYFDLKIGLVINSFILHDRAERSQRELSVEDQVVNYCNLLRLRFGDINLDFNEKDRLIFEKKKVIIRFLKRVISFDFVGATICLKQYTKIPKVFKEIKVSRHINRTVGEHYI